MDDLATRIAEQVIKLYPTIKADLSINDEYILVLVGDVIDRTLMYTNREQLVYQYELDLIDYPVNDNNAEFWAYYDYPIPPRIETVLARVVIQAAKTILDNNVANNTAIKSIKDNGQEITYAERMTNFFSSGSESEIFSGSLSLIDAIRLPKVIRNEPIY